MQVGDWVLFGDMIRLEGIVVSKKQPNGCHKVQSPSGVFLVADDFARRSERYYVWFAEQLWRAAGPGPYRERIRLERCGAQRDVPRDVFFELERARANDIPMGAHVHVPDCVKLDEDGDIIKAYGGDLVDLAGVSQDGMIYVGGARYANLGVKMLIPPRLSKAIGHAEVDRG